MPVSPALTADETAALEGASTILRYLSPVPDTPVATARINQASFAYPIAQLTVDGTSGGWANIKAGQTVYIGSSAGAHDKGIYRVRKAGNSTTLYLGELSGGDPGLLPQQIRTTAPQDNDYVTVLERWDLWSVLPRINPQTGVIYEDYDLTPGTKNTTPPPLAFIYINGRRNHLFDYITTDVLAITAVASATRWPTSGASDLSYAWTVPGAWTNVAGEDTDTLTANAPPGNYILYCTISDSVGGDTERVAYVHVHDAESNPPLLISNMPRSDTRDRVGRRMAFDLYDDRLASIPDGAAVGYFEVCTWTGLVWTALDISLADNITDSQTAFDVTDGSGLSAGGLLKIGSEWLRITGVDENTLTVIRGYNDTIAAAHTTGATLYSGAYTAADVSTATRQFVGWIQRDEQQGTAGLRQASIDLISPANVLGLLNSTSQLITQKASPATWQEAVPSLMSASFMAWYMLQWRTGNLLRLFNFTPFSVAPAGQRLPQWQIDKGTILQQIQQLATERGNFGCNSEGEFFFLRLPSMVDYADRDTIVIRDALTASIYSSIAVTQERVNRVSQVRGEAFSWDGSATLPTPYFADAPVSPGQGGAPAKLLAQVVTDQAEINQLTGDWYALRNNPYPSVSGTIQKNRDVYEPAELPFVTVIVPDYLSPTGNAFEISIVPQSVNKKHNPDGTADIELAGEGETSGLAAGTVPVPASNTSIYAPPYVPEATEVPQLGSLGDWSGIIPGAVGPTIPGSGAPTVVPGKGAIRNNDTQVFRTYDITVASPVWDEVTPTEFFTTIEMCVMDLGTSFSRRAYCLGTDGTDSKVAFTEDIFVEAPVWTLGATAAGLYQQIRSARGKPDVIYIAGRNLVPGECDFTNWAVWTEGGGGTLISTSATEIVVHSVDGGDGFWYAGVKSTGINDCCCNLDFTLDVPGILSAVGANPCGESQANEDFIDFSYTGESANGMVFKGAFEYEVTVFSNGACDDSVVAEPARSRRSTDNGTTWETERVFGTVLTNPGFGVSRFDLAALAGDTERVVISNDGGTYAAETRGGETLTGTYPIALCIPDLRNGSVSLTNISPEPSYIFATAALVSDEAFFKVINSRSSMTPSVSGTKATGYGPLGIDAWGGKKFMIIGIVDGTRYLFITKSTGAAWSHQQYDNANAVRARRFSPTGFEWVLALGADGLKYTKNGGTTWATKSADATLYAEVFG